MSRPFYLASENYNCTFARMSEVDGLYEKASERDPVAFAELYKQNHQLVQRVVTSICRNKSNADDALQETFLAIWNSRSKYELGTNFKAWISTVAKNCAKMANRNRVFTSIECDVTELKPKGCVLLEDKELVAESLAKLLPSDRQILQMHYLDSMSAKEVSSALGITSRAARCRINSALKRLSRILKDDHKIENE